MNIGWYNSLDKNEKALLAHMMTSYLNDALEDRYQISTVEKSIDISGTQAIVNPAAEKPNFGHGPTIKNQLNLAFGDNAPHEFTLNSMRSFCTWNDTSEYNSSHFPGEESNILCGVSHTSGGQQLFDSPVFEMNYVTMRFKSVYFTEPDSETSSYYEYKPSSDKELIAISLSPEQYIRIMRSDSLEIPCTITRSHGNGNDAPPKSINKHEKIKEALHDDLTAVMEPLRIAVNEALSLMEGKSFSSKKAMNELSEKIQSVIDAYQDSGDDMVEHQYVAAKDVATVHAERLHKQINYEVNRLPAPAQELARSQLSPLLEDMRKT